MNPILLRLGCALVLGSIIFLSGWTIKGWKDDSQYKKSFIQAMAAVKAQDVANQKMGQQYSREVEVYRGKVEELNEKADKEVQAIPSYGTCSIPDTGMQLLNSAVDAANSVASTSQSDDSL